MPESRTPAPPESPELDHADSPLESSSQLFGLSALLKSNWRQLSELDRDRVLTALMAAAAALRAALEPGTAPGHGPSADDVRAALERPSSHIHLQPIVRIPTREVMGFEALTRFPEWSPDRWFRQAWEIGIGLDLELLAVERALHSLATIPPDCYLSINVSPRTLISEDLFEVLEHADGHRIVLELTEHEVIGDYERYRSVIATLRARGTRIAIDDVGAGHSSLLHLIRLGPDIIKLDRGLIAGCGADPVLGTLMTCIATFARETGITVIAEGVETSAETAALISYGIEFGQGFYFD